MPGIGTNIIISLAFSWNTFLNHFGLEYDSWYNGVNGNIAISSTHPIFVSVDSLYQANGQDISDLFPSDPRQQILVSSGSDGLYAVYDSAVPVPASLWLLGSGLVGLWGWRRTSQG